MNIIARQNLPMGQLAMTYHEYILLQDGDFLNVQNWV